jgi:hypothetical protein
LFLLNLTSRNDNAFVSKTNLASCINYLITPTILEFTVDRKRSNLLIFQQKYLVCSLFEVSVLIDQKVENLKDLF